MKKTTTKKAENCMYPDCAEPGLIRIEDGWVCSSHMSELGHTPEALALTEADMELEKFRDDGGKVS